MRPALQAEGLYWTRGGREILGDISLTLAPGEILGVIGPNGAGKSSLLRLLARLEEPGQGALRLQGHPYGEWGKRDFAARLGYLEQKARVHWPLLARRVVEMGRLPHRRGLLASALSVEDREAVREAAANAGIEGLMERSMDRLSEGERMLVFLARLLAARPRVALADEPVAALDPHHQLMILETLRAMTASGPGFSAIIVLHDLTLAARFCDRLLLLDKGAIAAAGRPEEVLTASILKRHYRIEAEVGRGPEGLRVTALARRRDD